MSKADEMRARAARATQRTPSATRPNMVRAKPIRITADLSPQVYRGLIDYAAELASAQGRARVAHVHVVRALVAELIENVELQKAIARRVHTQIED
jgi:hypothetical protein